MKKSKMFLLAFAAFFLFTTATSYSQNFFKTEPDMCKMLGDTTFGTAAIVTFEPGQKTKTHTHAAQFVYAMTDGALKVHYADGRVMDFEMKAGDSFMAPPDGPHWTENTGKKAMKFILVEFNDNPYKEMKAKK